MKNFVANGASIQLVAAAPVVGGSLVKQGSLIGVVVADAAIGQSYTVKIDGVYNNCPKIAAEAWAVGDMLYLKADLTGLTKTSAGNTFAGYAYEAALAADVVGSILLSH